MATTVNIETDDVGHVLVREWSDFDRAEQRWFSDAAGHAADNRRITNEKSYVYQMVRIAIHPDDYEVMRDEMAFEEMTVAEAGRILTAVVPPTSVHQDLRNIKCIQVEPEVDS